MKKLISLILVMALCLSVFGAVAFADTKKDFADIKGHWAEADIMSMVEKGVINGVSDTEFAPDRTITRAEFLALIVRVLGAEQVEYTDAYTDVSASDWYSKVVQTGKNLGIIDSAMTPDGTFAPKANITREEMTSFIVRAYEYKTKETTSETNIDAFKDKGDIAPWATRYVEGAYSMGIVNGKDAETFAPKASAKRAEAATIICRLLKSPGFESGTKEETPIVETPEEEEKPAGGKSIKILSVGNSYSLDCMDWFDGIANSYGYDEVTMGIIYKSSCTLQMHYEYASTGASEYTYKKNTDGKWVDNSGATFNQCLQDEKWDIIVIHTANSGSTSTYEPHLTNLLKYIDENGTNPDVKLAWNMTWAHQHDSTHYRFTGTYNSDQMYMYEQIVAATKSQIKPRKEFDYFIPAGTAIQNTRTSFIGDTLTRDGYHLNLYLGRYIAALTWFSVLTETPIDDITYVPNKALIPDETRVVAIESVVNAIAKPYAVTKSKYKEAPQK